MRCFRVGSNARRGQIHQSAPTHKLRAEIALPDYLSDLTKSYGVVGALYRFKGIDKELGTLVVRHRFGEAESETRPAS